MTYISESLRRIIYERAGGRCEYCLIHDEDVYMPHEIDHIYAEKHGGETSEANLCLSCAICNRHKGSDLASLDPETGKVTPLYHPRLDRWEEHFQFDGASIEGRTPIGRATVRLLRFNTPERLLDRQELIRLGRYTTK